MPCAARGSARPTPQSPAVPPLAPLRPSSAFAPRPNANPAINNAIITSITASLRALEMGTSGDELLQTKGADPQRLRNSETVPPERGHSRVILTRNTLRRNRRSRFYRRRQWDAHRQPGVVGSRPPAPRSTRRKAVDPWKLREHPAVQGRPRAAACSRTRSSPRDRRASTRPAYASQVVARAIRRVVSMFVARRWSSIISVVWAKTDIVSAC